MDKKPARVCSQDIEFNQEPFILGRENEIEEIVKDFDKVLEGEFGVCLIHGEAGVGKTHLVSIVARKLVNVNTTYVYGKYKHYNNSLFSAMNEVFKGIVEHAFTFSDEKLEAVKKLLHAKLGVDRNLIIAICPETEKLLGYYRKINEEDYHKLEYRFHNAIFVFLDIMSQELYPLMIHLDDLQWADEGSSRLIDFLYRRRSALNFYLVLSLRDGIKEKNSEMSVLKSIIEVDELRLKLKRLNEEETKAFLGYFLKNEIRDKDEVSRYFFKATLGNPFYIRQLIETIYKENEVTFEADNQRWAFELGFLKKLHLPQDIKAILIHHIERLSSQEYELLQLLACLGGQANRKLLRKIITNESEEAIGRLESLCETDLLIKGWNENDEKDTRYYFSHDIIYEIMHSSMEKERKAKNHYRIAKRLINDPDKIFSEEHRIFIASQLLDCKYDLLKEADSTEYVLELYYAGVKAKQVTLIEDAIRFFELCLLLIPSSDEAISSEIMWKVKFGLAECLFLYGDIIESEKRFESLVNECENQQNLERIKSKFILLYTYSGNYKKALALGFEVLAYQGFKIRTDYVRFNLFKEIAISKFLLTNKKIEKLKYMPTVNDSNRLKIETTLIRLIAIANLIDEELFVLLNLKLSNLSVKHGNSELSAPAYSAYSFIAYHILGDKQKAFRLVEIAKTLAEDQDDIKCMTYFILGTFMEHWKSSGEESIAYLMRAMEIGVREGEFQYAGYSFAAMVEMKFVMGKSIADLVQTFELLEQFDSRLQQDITESTLFILQNHLDLLVDRNTSEIDDKTIAFLDSSQKLTYYYFHLQRLYIMGKIQDCYDLFGKIEPMRGMFKGYMMQVDLAFFMTIVRLDHHKRLKGAKRHKNKRMIDQSLKQFEQWISLYKENHYARYLYLKAKRLEVFNNSLQVGNLYEQGINFAKEKEHLFLVAMGNLLAANYYESNNKIASVYRQEAVMALDVWGASHYANLLHEKLFSESKNQIGQNISLREEEKESLYMTRNEQANRLMLCMKHVEELDKDNTFLYILKTIIEDTGAGFGAIFLEKNDQIYKVYEERNNQARKYDQAIPIKDDMMIPHKVVRYVARTGNEVLINEKPRGGLFVNDRYFDDKDKISVLCIPLTYMDVFVGIIYIEWNENKKNENFMIDDIKSYMSLLITKSIAEDRMKDDKKSTLTNEIPLTKREIEVFQLMIKGLTNKQMGNHLCISLSTVKTHIINIYSKLNIKNRVAAVEKAKELGMIN